MAIFLTEKGSPALQTASFLAILSLSFLNKNEKMRNYCVIGYKPQQNLSNISDISFYFTQLVTDEKKKTSEK